MITSPFLPCPSFPFAGGARVTAVLCPTGAYEIVCELFFWARLMMGSGFLWKGQLYFSLPHGHNSRPPPMVHVIFMILKKQQCCIQEKNSSSFYHTNKTQYFHGQDLRSLTTIWGSAYSQPKTFELNTRFRFFWSGGSICPQNRFHHLPTLPLCNHPLCTSTKGSA